MMMMILARFLGSIFLTIGILSTIVKLTKGKQWYDLTIRAKNSLLVEAALISNGLALLIL